MQTYIGKHRHRHIHTDAWYVGKIGSLHNNNNIPNSAFSDFVPFNAPNKELSTDWAHECIHLVGFSSILFLLMRYKNVFMLYTHTRLH